VRMWRSFMWSCEEVFDSNSITALLRLLQRHFLLLLCFLHFRLFTVWMWFLLLQSQHLLSLSPKDSLFSRACSNTSLLFWFNRWKAAVAVPRWNGGVARSRCSPGERRRLIREEERARNK